jgi:hypothetical protein
MCFVAVDRYSCGCAHPGQFEQCAKLHKTLIKCDTIKMVPHDHGHRCLFHCVPYTMYRSDLDVFDAGNHREDWIDMCLATGRPIVDKRCVNRWLSTYVGFVRSLTRL